MKKGKAIHRLVIKALLISLVGFIVACRPYMDEPVIMNMDDNINLITYEWEGYQLTTYGEWDKDVIHLWLTVAPEDHLTAIVRIFSLENKPDFENKDLYHPIGGVEKDFYGGDIDLFVKGLPVDDYYYMIWVE